MNIEDLRHKLEKLQQEDCRLTENIVDEIVNTFEEMEFDIDRSNSQLKECLIVISRLENDNAFLRKIVEAHTVRR